MRHRKKEKKLSRVKGPRQALLKSLAANLIIYEKIKTTISKAKVTRTTVERLITVGKKNNLTARRRLLRFLPDNAVKKILEVLGPKYIQRTGGYTKIRKIGCRQGDGAEMVQIELI